MGLAMSLAGMAFADEGAPPRRLAPPLDATQARVIVKFKSDASAVRQSPLGVARTSAAVQTNLQARANAVGQRQGLTLGTGRALTEHSQVMTASGLDSETLARRLRSDREVEYAVVDRRFTWLATPNDPLYAPVSGTSPAVGQWYLKAPSGVVKSSINASTAWDTTTGLTSVVVAVLDTGVRLDHPDLAANLVSGYDMVAGSVAVANDGNGRDADPSDPGDWITSSESTSGTFAGCTVEDSSWHGTQTSGLVAAVQNNGIGISGVAPGVKVQPVRVLGKCGGYESDIVAGMRWAAGIAVSGLPTNPTPAKVLNMSLGGSGSCGSVYAAAVNEVIAKGVSVVVAAGNSDGHALGAPANCTGVVAVGGLRHVGTKVGYSDLGADVTISAPAGNCENTSGACLYPIISTSNSGTTTPVAANNYYTNGNAIATSPVGTSFAAPLVAGTAALMVSANPSLTPAQVTALLKQSARPFPTTGASSASIKQCVAPTGADQGECYCTTSTCGAGMLDADGALKLAATGVVAVAAASPAVPGPNEVVQLSAATSIVSSNRSIVSTTWTLVDGGGIVTGFENGASTGTTVSVKPAATGAFTVRVDLVDDQGATHSATLTVNVDALSVAITPASSALTVGQVLQLSAANLSLANGRTLVSYAWAVTSGSNVVLVTSGSSGANLQLRGTNTGTATVQLTVTNDLGKQATATWTGTVTGTAGTDGSGGSTGQTTDASTGGGAARLADVLALLAAFGVLASAARRRVRGT